jgi:hypothetical protein
MGGQNRFQQPYGLLIYKPLRQRGKRGDITPLPHGGGAQAKFSKDHLMILTDLPSITDVNIGKVFRGDVS